MKLALQAAIAFVAGAALVTVFVEPYKPALPNPNQWVNYAPYKMTEAEKINARKPGYLERWARDRQIDSMNRRNEWRRDVISPLNQVGIQLRNWEAKYR